MAVKVAKIGHGSVLLAMEATPKGRKTDTHFPRPKRWERFFFYPHITPVS